MKKILIKAVKYMFKKHYSIGPTWVDDEEFDEGWKNRISLIASYIDIPGRVIDYGCGMMWLENCLNSDNEYVPVDYVKRDERTHVVDLNKYPLQKIKGEVAVFSGVLEYIENFKEFYADISVSKYKQIVLSYCTIEKHPVMEYRKTLGWKSHESIFTLLSVFSEHYMLHAIDDINQNTILVFRRKNQ